MAIPVGAIASVAGGIVAGRTKKRIEAHIRDRVKKFQSLSNEQLQNIMAGGGEAGEAARRVLSARPVSIPTTALEGMVETAPGVTQNPGMIILIVGGALAILLLARR